MKKSTIGQVITAILKRGEEETTKIKYAPQRDYGRTATRSVANEAAIYLITAYICERDGIDLAMEYFTGSHAEDEYKIWETDPTKREGTK